MKLIKGFQKVSLNKDILSSYNILIGQIDANFRSVEGAINGIYSILETIKAIRGGQAVLVAGSVTVSDAKITNNSLVFLCSNIDGGTPGFLRVSAISESVSFTITSSNGADTSTVSYLIIDRF